MHIPTDRRFSEDELWVLPIDGGYRIGLTEMAADALGEVSLVRMPSIGVTIRANDAIAEIEAAKAVSELGAPVGGQIAATNTALDDMPTLVHTDPYDTGWLCELQSDDAASFSELFTPEQYEERAFGEEDVS